MLQSSFAVYNIMVEEEESSQALETTHDLCDCSQQSTLSRSGQAIYPQSLLCIDQVICDPLHNVINDVAPHIIKTSSAIVFVHKLWFQ